MHTANVRERHRKVVKSILSGNVRKDGKRISKKQAMLDAGYSKSYSEQAGVSRTKSYPKLLEEIIPNSELIAEHKKLLHDKEIMHYSFPKSQSDETIKEIITGFGFPVMRIEKVGEFKRAYFAVMNAKAKKDALDMAYKIKKLYTNGTHIEITNPFEELSDEQLHRRGLEIYARISKRLRGAGAAGGGGKEKGGK